MKRLLIAILVSISSAVYASCPNLYPGGVEIVVPNTIELCNSFYVSRYNISQKAVVVTFEKLSKDSPVGSLKRAESFRADSRVKDAIKPSAYSNSGFDKGHMAPSDDASSVTEMADTFLMTNMTPQEPTLNEKAWKVLENEIRKQFLKSYNDFYITTVAVYSKSRRTLSGIPIPSGYWKIVNHGSRTDYYYAPNILNGLVTQKQSADFNQILLTAQEY